MSWSGSGKVSQQSVLSHPTNIFDARRKQRGHPTPAPPWQQGKQIPNIQKAKNPLKISTASTGIQAGTRVQSGNPNLYPSSFSFFLDEGRRGPCAPPQTPSGHTRTQLVSTHILTCVSKFLPQILPEALPPPSPSPILTGRADKDISKFSP